MTEFNSFLNDKIAVSFNSDHALFKQELIAFLTLCESNGIDWSSGDPALDEDMIDYLQVGKCISYCSPYVSPLMELMEDFAGYNSGLAYSSSDVYLRDGYNVVPCTDFFAVKD